MPPLAAKILQRVPTSCIKAFVREWIMPDNGEAFVSNTRVDTGFNSTGAIEQRVLEQNRTVKTITVHST